MGAASQNNALRIEITKSTTSTGLIYPGNYHSEHNWWNIDMSV